MKNNFLVPMALSVFACSIIVFSGVIKLKEADAVCVAHSFKRDLKEGTKGVDVESLQRFLGERGYLKMPPGAAYGYFGAMTKTALIKYQKYQGLTAQGYFGPLTRANVIAHMTSTCVPNTTINNQNQSQGFSQKSVNNNYNDYSKSLYPTEAEAVRMPVYIASLKGDGSSSPMLPEMKNSIKYPGNAEYITLDDIGFNNTYQANEKFIANVVGGSGNYKTFWHVDNLETPKIYDESFSDYSFTRSAERTLSYSFKNEGMYLITILSTDDIGNRSASSSQFVIVLSKSLSEKISKYEAKQLTITDLQKDSEYNLFTERLYKAFASIKTHPAALDNEEESRVKSLSASVKSNLSSMRAEAELYSMNNSNSYLNFCKSTVSTRLLKESESGIQGSPNCIDSINYWRAFVTLKENGKFFCVDSFGHAIQTERISGYKCQ